MAIKRPLCSQISALSSVDPRLDVGSYRNLKDRAIHGKNAYSSPVRIFIKFVDN